MLALFHPLIFSLPSLLLLLFAENLEISIEPKQCSTLVPLTFTATKGTLMKELDGTVEFISEDQNLRLSSRLVHQSQDKLVAVFPQSDDLEKQEKLSFNVNIKGLEHQPFTLEWVNPSNFLPTVLEGIKKMDCKLSSFFILRLFSIYPPFFFVKFFFSLQLFFPFQFKNSVSMIKILLSFALLFVKKLKSSTFWYETLDPHLQLSLELIVHNNRKKMAFGTQKNLGFSMDRPYFIWELSAIFSV